MTTKNHPLGNCVLALDFGLSGNAGTFLRRGWSGAEAEFTWSCGEESLIHLPVQGDRTRDWLLVLEGHPYLHLPETFEQRVAVYANDTEIFRFSTDTTFRRVVRVSASQIEGEAFALKLCLPTCDSPSKYGSEDTRLLAIAMYRLFVIEVSPARPPGLLLPWPPLAPRDAQRLDALMLTSLIAGEFGQITAAIADVFPSFKIDLSIKPSENLDFSVVYCSLDAERKWMFEFSPNWTNLVDTNPAARMVVWHFLATLPLFIAYSFSNRIQGSVLLSLGDEAHGRGLAFCAQSVESSLIPDPYFMRSFGYKDLKSQMAKTAVSYDRRRPAALWRGGTTGYRAAAANVFALPRVQLCILAVHTRLSANVDVGFTNFVQIRQDEEEVLRDLGLVKAFVEPIDFVNWMFHIDIDGNTNSWPGLFQKMISAGVVLRVASEANWKQWYYNRLEPDVNFVSVDENFHDLRSKLLYLTYNKKASEEIGQRGALLARSMTYENELDLAMCVFEDAIGRETLGVAA